jgi:hypothetical protein
MGISKRQGRVGVTGSTHPSMRNQRGKLLKNLESKKATRKQKETLFQSRLFDCEM